MFGQITADLPPAPGEEAKQPSATAEQPRLLIIEDAVIHSTIISVIAAKSGFATKMAGSFEAACELLRERPFDCITLDLGLGQHAGSEVIDHLSAIDYAAPLIIISGSERLVCDETVAYARSRGLNVLDPVPKPIDVKALRETLNQVRTRSSLADIVLP